MEYSPFGNMFEKRDRLFFSYFGEAVAGLGVAVGGVVCVVGGVVACGWVASGGGVGVGDVVGGVADG